MPLLDKQGIHAGCRWELSSHVFSSVLSFTHASLKLAHETEHGGNSSWNTARETPAGKELGLSSWSCSRWSIDSASPFYDYHKLALSSLNTHAPGIAVKERNLHFKKSSLIVSEQFHGGKFPERDTRVRRTPLSERSAGTPRGAEPRERLRNANSDARRGPTGLRAAQTPPSRAEPRAETQNRRPGTGTDGYRHAPNACTDSPPAAARARDGTRPAALPAPLGSASTSREATPPSVPPRSASATPALGAERQPRTDSGQAEPGQVSREDTAAPDPKRTSTPRPSSAAGCGRTPPLRSAGLAHCPRPRPSPRPSRPAQQRLPRPQGGGITELGCRALPSRAEPIDGRRPRRSLS